MEEKIYDRQVTKQSLSMRVVDEKQIGRHFSFSQLQELFVYTPPPPPPASPSSEAYEIPESDIIFRNLLDKLRPHCIVGYHTHDSLLEHIFDEELSAEEQKLAWDSYNMQKEMDSREYNMSLQLQQQHKAILQSANIGTSSAGFGSGIGLGTSLAGPSSGASGVSFQQSNIVPPSFPPVVNTNVIQHIKSVLEIAKQVRGLYVLRNQLAGVIQDPNNLQNVPAKNRYILTCAAIDSKMDLLNKGSTPILNILRNPQLQSYIPANSHKDFVALGSQLNDFIRTIQALRQVSVPDYKSLITNPNNVPLIPNPNVSSALVPNLLINH